MDGTGSPPQSDPGLLSAFKAKLHSLRTVEEAEKEMLAGRYVEVPDSERETEDQRFQRIWDTPGAWS